MPAIVYMYIAPLIIRGVPKQRHARMRPGPDRISSMPAPPPKTNTNQTLSNTPRHRPNTPLYSLQIHLRVRYRCLRQTPSALPVSFPVAFVVVAIISLMYKTRRVSVVISCPVVVSYALNMFNVCMPPGLAQPMPTNLNQFGRQSSFWRNGSPSHILPVTQPLHLGELGQLRKGMCW